jgi:hypothetical protein
MKDRNTHSKSYSPNFNSTPKIIEPASFQCRLISIYVKNYGDLNINLFHYLLIFFISIVSIIIRPNTIKICWDSDETFYLVIISRKSTIIETKLSAFTFFISLSCSVL